MKLLWLVFMLGCLSTCTVSGYGECAKYVYTNGAEQKGNECLISFNTQMPLWTFLSDTKEAHKILTSNLQTKIINKAVPKCLIVTFDSKISDDGGYSMETTKSALSIIRAESKCLVIPMECDLKAQKMQNEGRFHNFDIIIVSNKNSSKEILWKKSYERRFDNYHRTKLTDTRYTLEVAHVPIPPFYIRGRDDEFVGMDANLWKIIGNHMKLQIIFLKTRNNGGTINKIREGQAHASGMQLIFSRSWFAGNDITPPMFLRELSLYAKYPDLKSSYQTLLGPLNFSVWMAVLATVISTAIVLIIFHRCLGEDNFCWFYVTVPSYSVLISESMPYHVMYAHMSASKITLLVFLIPLSTLLSYAYRTNLLASLVKQEHEKPVDTYQDIIDRDMTIYMINGTAMGPLLANSPNPVIVKAYWNNLVGKDGIYSLGKGKIPAMVSSALHSGKGVIMQPKEQERLYIRKGKELNVGSFICGYYLSMGHPLTPEIKRLVQSLVETGNHQVLVDRFVRAQQANLRKVKRLNALEKRNWSKLGNDHIMPVYLMSSILIGLSCLVFLGDLYLYIKKHIEQSK